MQEGLEKYLMGVLKDKSVIDEFLKEIQFSDSNRSKVPNKKTSNVFTCVYDRECIQFVREFYKPQFMMHWLTGRHFVASKFCVNCDYHSSRLLLLRGEKI